MLAVIVGIGSTLVLAIHVGGRRQPTVDRRRHVDGAGRTLAARARHLRTWHRQRHCVRRSAARRGRRRRYWSCGGWRRRRRIGWCSMAAGGLAAAAECAGAARGSAALAGGATAAYRAGGATGVATTGLARSAEAVMSPLRRAAGSLKSSFEAAGQATAGEGAGRRRRRASSPHHLPQPPAWARRMKRVANRQPWGFRGHAMPFAPAITVVAARLSICLEGEQLMFKRPSVRYGRTPAARNALSEGGASLGRAYRLGAGSGQQLAADGVRFV